MLLAPQTVGLLVQLKIAGFGRGTWCSGITPAQHAGGPGLNPQRVHFYATRFTCGRASWKACYLVFLPIHHLTTLLLCNNIAVPIPCPATGHVRNFREGSAVPCINLKSVVRE